MFLIVIDTTGLIISFDNLDKLNFLKQNSLPMEKDELESCDSTIRKLKKQLNKN